MAAESIIPTAIQLKLYAFWKPFPKVGLHLVTKVNAPLLPNYKEIPL